MKCRAAWAGLALVMLGTPGCRRDESSKAKLAPGSDSAKPAKAELVLGPPKSSTPSAEREQALRDLLEGRSSAARFPLVVTSPGIAYDPDLFETLTTRRVATTRDELGYQPPSKALGNEATISNVVIVRGALHLPSTERRLSATRRRWLSCHAKALEVQPGLVGDLTALVKTAPGGAVTAATIEKAPAKSKVLTDCVQKYLLGHEFAASDDGKPTAFRFTVKFTLPDG